MRGLQECNGLYHFTVSPTLVKETNSIADIGFHYVATVDAMPSDTDHDGVADYLEDGDGDGAQDAGETDYLAPISGGDGRLDGEVRAGEPQLEVVAYKGEAALDYTTPQRGMETPDRTFTIAWHCRQESTAEETENRMECYTPPIPDGTVYLIVKNYAWPAVGTGVLSSYGEVTGGGPKVIFEKSESTRPPYSFPIPCEKCVTFSGNTPPPANQPGFNGTFSRANCSTTQKLHPGGTQWPKKLRSVVLHCEVLDKSGGESTRDAEGRITMREPDDRRIGTPVDPTVRRIMVSTERVNADGSLMLQLPVNYHPPARDVSPMIDGMTWYMWELTLGQHHTVRMTWSRHPAAGSGDVQTKFDEGARLLAKDDDTLVVNPTDPQDDVPTYLEFLIIEANQKQFPPPFADAAYNVIQYYEELEWLRAACFANIKMVTDIRIVTGANPPTYLPLLGYASPGSEGLVYKVSSLDGIVAVHEYGHTVGLQHRTSNTNAVMYNPYGPTLKETDSAEGAAYQAFTPDLWNGDE